MNYYLILQLSGQQQLDKSREIIRQLKEQKHQLEEQIQHSENSRHTTTTTTTTQDSVDYNVEASKLLLLGFFKKNF